MFSFFLELPTTLFQNGACLGVPASPSTTSDDRSTAVCLEPYGRGRCSSAITRMACGSALTQSTQNGMEHTTTALPSWMPLLHRWQKYMGASSGCCASYDLRTTLGLSLKGVWSTLLTPLYFRQHEPPDEASKPRKARRALSAIM